MIMPFMYGYNMSPKVKKQKPFHSNKICKTCEHINEGPFGTCSITHRNKKPKNMACEKYNKAE